MEQYPGIIVVDDDRINTMATVKTLETSRQFHRIRTAPGGRKGLETLMAALGEDCPATGGDLILIDLDMREMSGLAFIRSLLRLRPLDHKLRGRIMVTAAGSVRNTCYTKLLGIGLFLEKPLTLNAIQIAFLSAKGEGGGMISVERPDHWLDTLPESAAGSAR